MSLWRQVQAIVLLPGVVTVAIPALILTQTRRDEGTVTPIPLSALLGLPFIGIGLLLMARTIHLFATEGQGTLSPLDSTRRLVVRGPYRHVRNPMITGVFSILLGEAIIFTSLPLLGWFLAVVLLNNVYIPLSEEPGLEQRFGEDYRVYKANVPRWLPRRTAWTPPWQKHG